MSRATAGVADAAEALCQLLRRQLFPQGGEPSFAFYHADAAVQRKRHTGGVVPAILQLFQTIQQNVLRVALANITNNATHTKYLQTDSPALNMRTEQLSASLPVYVLVWLSLKGSVAVLLPFFALLCGWSSPQPEKHPPNLSMIPLLVTLTAVTRVARRFVSTKSPHSFFQCPLSLAALASSPKGGALGISGSSCCSYGSVLS